MVQADINVTVKVSDKQSNFTALRVRFHIYKPVTVTVTRLTNYRNGKTVNDGTPTVLIADIETIAAIGR